MIITLQYIGTQWDVQGWWFIITLYMNTMGCPRLVDDNYLTIYRNTMGCPRLVVYNYLIYEHSGMSKVVVYNYLIYEHNGMSKVGG